MKARIGVVYFNEIKKEELIWALLQLGIDPLLMDSDISIYSTAHEDALKIAAFIEENSATAMLSYDFSATISDACSMKGIPYISWIYDCPQKALYEDAVTNDCNFIFSFDKRQVETVKKYGGKNVFYQPLGTNMLKNSGLVIEAGDEARFSCEVSFIGNLFRDSLFDLADIVVDEVTKKEYRDVIKKAFGKWDGQDRLHCQLSEHALDQLKSIDRSAFEDDFKMDIDDFFAVRLLAYSLASQEREDMLKRLAPYGLRFYTGEENVHIDGVVPLPPLSYTEELPKAYYLSKINMNITLHTITQGLPLRIFDIMGVGGFVLSNYQPAIDDLFEIGKEIEVYHDLDEMEDKVRFYLSHDSSRQLIAINGYKAVKENYDNTVLIRKMLEIASAI
jgi:spore maturation protein CgeB